MPETAVASPTPSVETPATPATQEPGQSAQGTTPAVGGDAGNGQGAPTEESFYSGNPSSLPPQMREVFENMNRDYKAKTQKIADERKGFEDAKKKADLYDQMSNDKNFVAYWNGLSKGEQDQAKSDMAADLGISDEDFVKAFESKDSFFQLMKRFQEKQSQGIQQRLDEAHQKIREAEAEQIIGAFTEATDKSGQRLRPDFDKLENIRLGNYGMVNVFLLQDKAATRNPEEQVAKLEKAYKNAKGVYDSIFEEGRKAGLGLNQKRVNNATEAPTITAGQTFPGGDPKKLSVAEAHRYAKQGITVPRD